MTAAQYSLLAALIFALVALLQLIRAVMSLPVTAGQTSIPIWASCGLHRRDHPRLAWIYSI
jgi:hypothetical protein